MIVVGMGIWKEGCNKSLFEDRHNQNCTLEGSNHGVQGVSSGIGCLRSLRRHYGYGFNNEELAGVRQQVSVNGTKSSPADLFCGCFLFLLYKCSFHLIMVRVVTSNHSIIVIEDIDCNREVHIQSVGVYKGFFSQHTGAKGIEENITGKGLAELQCPLLLRFPADMVNS
ncbi:hypothetical protein VNO80_09698 [Phaseolus coccineus]|uniref:Uncharacterized protein n=1 Tax=Phaseolus coccineus TaxID=3886 RepID=A0AAN9N6N2_PHACN